LRSTIVRNSNLAKVYDILELDTLLPPYTQLYDEKSKADIVESIIGELDEKKNIFLNEFLSYIRFSGEENYFNELNNVNNNIGDFNEMNQKYDPIKYKKRYNSINERNK